MTFKPMNTTLHTSNGADGTQTNFWDVHKIIVVAIATILAPIIIGTNAIVVVSVKRFERLQVPANYFICSLAVIDIITGTCLPAYAYSEVQLKNFATEILCLLPTRIMVLLGAASIFTIALIAYDRRTSIVHPLEYFNIMTNRKAIILIICTWVYTSVNTMTPMFAGWYDGITDNNHSCLFVTIHNQAHIMYLVGVILPSCVVISVCYFRIYKAARHQARAIAAIETSVWRSLPGTYNIRDRKYAKTVSLVIGTFIILVMPYQLLMLIRIVPGISIDQKIQKYFLLCSVVNSVANPWVYAYKNRDFRAVFRQICRGNSAAFIASDYVDRHGLVSTNRTMCVQALPLSGVGRDRINSNAAFLNDENGLREKTLPSLSVQDKMAIKSSQTTPPDLLPQTHCGPSSVSENVSEIMQWYDKKTEFYTGDAGTTYNQRCFYKRNETSHYYSTDRITEYSSLPNSAVGSIAVPNSLSTYYFNKTFRQRCEGEELQVASIHSLPAHCIRHNIMSDLETDP